MFVHALFSALLRLAQAAGGTYDERLGTEIEYRLYRPELQAGESAPLVVYLHAYSENPMFSEPWFQESLQEAEPSFLLLPHCLKDGGNAADWGGTYDADLRPTLAEVVDVVDSLVAVHAIDPRRVYVYGGSMGAEAVFALLAYRPGLAAGAVAVAGYTRSDATKAKAMAGTPLWILHGGDDDLNPTSSSRNIFRAIRAADGRRVRYTEYPGYGHNDIWGRVPSESTMMPWLLSQIRDSIVTGNGPGPVQGLRRSGDTLFWSLPDKGKEPWFHSVYLDDSLLEQVPWGDTAYLLGDLPEDAVLTVSVTDMLFRESERVGLSLSSRVAPRSVGRVVWHIAGDAIQARWGNDGWWKIELRSMSGSLIASSRGSGAAGELVLGAVRGPAFVVLRHEGMPVHVARMPLLD